MPPENIPPEVLTARTTVAQLAVDREALLGEFARRGSVDHERLSAIDDRNRGELEGALRFHDACDASADVPLVLLPVRLETRFAADGQKTLLKVRIVPDDIHVDDLARGLTAEELAAGTMYWTAAWTDPVPEAAWPTLVAAVGAERAEWVAHACTPSNLAGRGADGAPSFDPVAPRGPRNVVARALPDRFVVLAVQGDQVSEAVGRVIPRDLVLSPIPLDDDPMTRAADALAVARGAEWLVDYDRALEVGMAVTVPLELGTAPVDRVIAIGTRGSAAPDAGAAELEDLLAGHRFSTGLGLLAQGTPTNNADAERSPYRPRRAPVPPALAPPVAAAGSDTVAAAQVLGVDAAVLTGLVGEGNGEQSASRNVNTALWTPGWGEYLSRLDAQGIPGVVDAQREAARELFRDHVRGRGGAPAIHVGAQPYGVLAVSDLRAWVAQPFETTAGVLHAVRALLGRWLFAAGRNVPLIRKGSGEVDTTFLEVLGSSPVMQGLRARPVVSDDVSDAVIASLGLDHREYEAERMSTIAVIAGLVPEHADKLALGSLHRHTRPLPLPLASARDPEFIEALLASPSRTLAVDSVLQALLVLSWRSSELDVAKAAPASVVPALIDLIDVGDRLKIDAGAIAARADEAQPQELHAMAAQLQAAGVTAGGPSMLREFQPVEQIQTSLAEVALSSPPTADAKVVAGAAFAGWLVAMGYRGEVRAAMQALSSTAVAARALAVGEALDCSSHRLDAWASAIVSDRRANQVAGAGDHVRGLTIGAYGIVENLRPQAGPSLDGWIHAPSTRHAIAAGMLRSAQLSHLGDAPAGDGGAFAIDLSSRRIQSAHHVIEGVRQGQQLGALIGYQIERGLADARLSRLALSLRTIAPLVARRLSDDDGADSQAARESVAATNVVDGVLLLHTHPPGDSSLRSALDEPPKNSYLPPGGWTPLGDDEWAAVTTILSAAADTIDAVSDVMLSESVLQYAGGNPHRAAAAMDAMSTGASPSDTIDVLEAQDAAERLTHRVLAVVAADVPASAWNGARPRALADPRLEAWAAAHLGDPANIVLSDAAGQRLTLGAAGLCALDLVFATDLLALERTLRVIVPALGDAALAVMRDPAWPPQLRALGQVAGLAASLRTIIAGAAPLLPADLTRPGEKPVRELASALPELTARLSALAASYAAAVAWLQATVASIPPDGIVADDASAATLARAAYALEPYGIALEPIAARPLDLSWVRDAWHTADARSRAAQAAAAQLAALPADTPVSLALDAAQEAVGTVYGDGFLVLPLLAPGPAADPFVSAVAAPVFQPPAASALRRFVRDVGTVRPQVGRLSEALLLGAALGHPRTLAVAQLAAEGAPGTTHWLAGPLPTDGPWPQSPVAHVVLDRVGTIDASAPIAGLAIDGWMEDLPAQVGPKADPDDPRPGRARTGLAIRCDSASARPPQAVLSAISPDGQRWTTASLRGVIEQTLDLAKVRMVTLERLAGDALVLPALYTKSWSLQGEEEIKYIGLLDRPIASVTMPWVREGST